MKTALSFFLLLALATAGCGASRPTLTGNDFSFHGEMNRLKTSLSFPELREDKDSAAMPEPGEFDRGQLLALMAAWSPSLRAEFREYAKAAGRTIQAGLWPNPQLQLIKEMIPVDEIGHVDGTTKVNLSQKIELGGKRGAREKAAGALQRLALENFRAAARREILEIDKLYYSALRMKRDLTLAGEELEAARELAELAAARYEGGKISLQEKLKFQVARDDAELAAVEIETDLRALYRLLESRLGLKKGVINGVKGEFSDPLAAYDGPEFAAALTSHPRYAARDLAVNAAKLGLSSVEADAWPDLTVMLMGARNDPDHSAGDPETFLGLGLSLPIPLFDLNQGKRLEASALIKQAEDLLKKERLDLLGELRSATSRFEGTKKLVSGYKDSIIPSVEKTYRLSLEAYKGGKTSYLEVLDSFILLLKAKRTLNRHLETLSRAAAEIEYLTGMKPEKQ